MIISLLTDILILTLLTRQPKTEAVETVSAMLEIQAKPEPVLGLESLVVVDASATAKLAEEKEKEEREEKYQYSENVRRIIAERPAPEAVQAMIDQYAVEYGVDAKRMKTMASCESGFNPGAVNGTYGGMYQYLASTWSSNRQAMGLDPSPDLRFNAEEAIKTTAYKMARDGVGAWPVCGRI